MKKHVFKLLALLLAISTISCSDDDNSTSSGTSDTSEEVQTFHVLANINNEYFIAPTDTLTEGSLTFVNNGTQLESAKAARVLASGGYVYSLNYGTGIVTQYKPNSDGGYDEIAQLDAGTAVGTVYPRFKLASDGDDIMMVYNVDVEAVTDTDGNITDNICTFKLVTISLPDFSITNLVEYTVPQTENAQQGGTIGYDVVRVDCPVISGDKIYFGLMHSDMSDHSIAAPYREPKQTGLETLVFDYPSFENGTITELDQASGHTSGYRSFSMYADEEGDVYQVNWFMTGNGFDLSGGDKTVITRLKDGAYDESYLFNISEALGLTSNIGAVGWFYVGDGIGYMPIHIEDEGSYYLTNSWSVLRVDIYNQTVVQMNVPLSHLFTYESGVVANGKFYMAIGPIGGESYVYEFDPESTSPDGFTTGLQFDGGDVVIEGIY